MSDVDVSDIDVVGKAIADIYESCYLRGPPGAGKTTQCLARGHRLLSGKYDISDVCWVTYRRELADDTLSRLEDAGVVDEDELEAPASGKTRHIGTMHAVAYRLIRDKFTSNQMEELGVEPHEKLIVANKSEKIKFCKYRNINYFTQKPWDKSPGKLLFRAFNWLRNNMYDPLNPDAWHECPHIQDIREAGFSGSLIDVYEEWQEYKMEKGMIDFADMLTECLEHDIDFQNKNILVVDEFHDATPLMAEVAKKWADTIDIVILAGDEDQIVNGYAGPSRELFDQMRNELDLDEVLLDHSYRVKEEHWTAATRLLRNAHTPPSISRNGFGGKIIEYQSPSFHASETSEEWGDVPGQSENLSPVNLRVSNEGSMMFLARMRMQVAGISYSLNKEGVIHRCQKDLGGWVSDDDDARLDLHNALQKLTQADTSTVISTSETRLDQFRDETKPLDTIKLSSTEIASLLDHTPANHLSQSRSETDDLKSNITDAELSMSLAELKEYTTESFWSEMIQGPRSARRLNKCGMSDMEKNALVKALSRYDNPVYDVDTDVHTIHAAKGKEAEHVVVYDGISSRIESEMHVSPKTENNEWRTWYVALTRASDTIHIMREGFPTLTKPIIPGNLLESVSKSLEEARGEG